MSTDYDALINAAAVATANERHRQVRLRLDAAQARLAQAQAARAQAMAVHETALSGDGGDCVTTGQAVRDADAAVSMCADAIPAVQRAIDRSAVQLRGEIAAAHAPARDKAEADLLAAAQEIDDLRSKVRDALARYRTAAIACNHFNNLGCPAASVNALAPFAGEAIAWFRCPMTVAQPRS